MKTPRKEFHCKECGNGGFRSVQEVIAHRRRDHAVIKHHQPRVMDRPTEVEYSFFNSPKEVRLTLGAYELVVRKIAGGR